MSIVSSIFSSREATVLLQNLGFDLLFIVVPLWGFFQLSLKDTILLL